MTPPGRAAQGTPSRNRSTAAADSASRSSWTLWPASSVTSVVFGRSAANGQFEVLLESREPIAPDPYLVQSSPRFASAMRSPLLKVVQS